MGVAAKAITGFLRLGGTGAAWTTPISRDVVYADATGGDFTVGGVTISADKAMRYVPFFAAVRNISEDVAGLPLNVYRRTDEGRSRDDQHPVDRLLGSAPNPFMTAFTFRETLQSHVLTWGNGYAEIEFATDGSILNLWPLPPDRVSVFVDRATDQVKYRVGLKGGGRVDLPRKKVFHLHGLGFDGLVGYSVIERARHMLGMALSAERYGEDWFEKGGIPPAYLSHPKELSDRGRENLRTSIDNGTLTDRHRMALLEEGMDIKTIGLPPRDSAFLEANGMTRSLTATLFRMPPDMLQDVTRSTSWGTGIEQQGIGYVKYTLRSHLTRWEQEGNQRLLANEDRYLRHVVDALMRGDSAARWTAYGKGADLGVYSIDDILEMEDRNPLPDGLGKQHFVQLNRVPLDQMGEMTMEQRLAALGGLVRAGFVPESAADALELPDVEHTGLEPVAEQTKPQLRVVKMAEFRCGECGKLLVKMAGPGTVADCSRCKVERVQGEPEPADPFKGIEDRLDALPERFAAAMPRQEPPTVTIAEGAIRIEPAQVNVNVPPQPPPNVTVNLPPQRPVTKTVAYDKNGKINKVTETPDAS